MHFITRPPSILVCRQSRGGLTLCYTVKVKLNLTTAWEDVRRLGVILTSAGLLAGVLEEGNRERSGGALLAYLAYRQGQRDKRR